VQYVPAGRQCPQRIGLATACRPGWRWHLRHCSWGYRPPLLPRAPSASGSKRRAITPPPWRENAALKFLVALPSLAGAGTVAGSLGGALLQAAWAEPGFRACNAVDGEGHVFPLRGHAPALV